MTQAKGRRFTNGAPQVSWVQRFRMRRQFWVQPSQPFRSIVPVRLECELESDSEIVSQVTVFTAWAQRRAHAQEQCLTRAWPWPRVPSATGAHPGAFSGLCPGSHHWPRESRCLACRTTHDKRRSCPRSPRLVTGALRPGPVCPGSTSGRWNREGELSVQNPPPVPRKRTGWPPILLCSNRFEVHRLRRRRRVAVESPSGGPAWVFRGSHLATMGCTEPAAGGEESCRRAECFSVRVGYTGSSRVLCRSTGEQDLGQAVVSHAGDPLGRRCCCVPAPGARTAYSCACSQVPTLALSWGRESTFFLAAG
ncbi:uncharacterized protein LOC123930958 [Meles meles]|uniref:uncharacterized protein LOC123930958 n=1 Tax=Meles meles TaxID=9662 RepID=UPI001E69D6F1|nr:uncharacterized protein LOC123930958 [Meles meles]